nr:MAG TPA: hypothetical protein [Caudoviricetes sp.]DAU90997.1 MAG TPA: hypothetical protein [Caudoviricetes sp.]
MKALRTLDAVRFLLSVSAFTMIAKCTFTS